MVTETELLASTYKKGIVNGNKERNITDGQFYLIYI
jgi:hypothetical protein